MQREIAKAFLDGIKKGNPEQIDYFLSQWNDPLQLLEIKDQFGNTAFHYAAANGYVELFYHLLTLVWHSWGHPKEQLLNHLINQMGKSPWHYAAQFGHSEFFNPIDLANANLVWPFLIDRYLNLPDDDGNTALHLAIMYNKKDSEEKIKRKKKTCRALTNLSELAINQQNSKGNTALHLAIMGGCFETAKLLLDVNRDKKNNLKLNFDLKNSTELTANELAAKLGRQRIDNLYFLSRNPKNAKVKAKNKVIDFNTIKAYACNPHLHNEEFFRRLKFTDLSEIEIREVIRLRLEKMYNKYRNKSLLVAGVASLCPAFFVNVFANYVPIPLLSTLLIGIIFPLAYVPFVYVCYQSRMREYNAVTAETIYFSWLATTLAAYVKNFNKKVKGLYFLAAGLKQELHDRSNDEEFLEIKDRYERLQQDYAELIKKASKMIEFSANKKPKLLTTQLSRTDFKLKKKLGKFDHKKNSRWIHTHESVMAFIGHTADILCPLGAGVELAATICALVAGGFSVSFPPILIAGAAIAGTVLLGSVIGYVLYKACYKKDQAEMGEHNRELVMAYDACKQSVNLLKPQRLNNNLQECLNGIQTTIQFLEKKVANKPNNKIFPLNDQIAAKCTEILEPLSSVSKCFMA